MSYLDEYISRKLNPIQLEEELMKLINEYDEITGKHLFVYSVDLNKYDLPNDIRIDDLYIIKDILRNTRIIEHSTLNLFEIINLGSRI